MKWKFETKKLTDIKPWAKNPRRLKEKGLEDLGQSISKFGLPEPIVINTDGTIIGGHARYLTLKKQNTKEAFCAVPEKKLKEKDLAELNIRLNKNIAGEFDFDILDIEFERDDLLDFGFEEKELKKQMGNLTEQIKLEPAEMRADILQKIKSAEKIYFSFSGGRDSCLALAYVLPLLKQKQNPEALHVDTGAEFPDLLPFVIDFCEKLDISLKVLKPKQNILEYYFTKKKFPDSIFRDCLQKFINEPLDDYIKKGCQTENFLLIRGGHQKQKTSISKSNFYQEISKGKFTAKLLNPLWSLSEKEQKKILSKIPLWENYKRGFDRTACWFCPFQKPTQWVALKKWYPALWYTFKDVLLKKMELSFHEGDGTIVRLKKYWGLGE